MHPGSPPDPRVVHRTVELKDGKIEIDGYDISRIGLDVLRGRLALVPQDSTLFLGTLRENLQVWVDCHTIMLSNFPSVTHKNYARMLN